MGVTASKTCAWCGIDVSRLPRRRDQEQRYYCDSCWAARSTARARAKRAAAAGGIAAPDGGGGPIAFAEVLPPAGLNSCFECRGLFAPERLAKVGGRAVCDECRGRAAVSGGSARNRGGVGRRRKSEDVRALFPQKLAGWAALGCGAGGVALMSGGVFFESMARAGGASAIGGRLVMLAAAAAGAGLAFTAWGWSADDGRVGTQAWYWTRWLAFPVAVFWTVLFTWCLRVGGWPNVDVGYWLPGLACWAVAAAGARGDVSPRFFQPAPALTVAVAIGAWVVVQTPGRHVPAPASVAAEEERPADGGSASRRRSHDPPPNPRPNRPPAVK